MSQLNLIPTPADRERRMSDAAHNTRFPCFVCDNRATDLSRFTHGGERMVDVLLNKGRNEVQSEQGHALCQTCIKRLEQGPIDMGHGVQVRMEDDS